MVCVILNENYHQKKMPRITLSCKRALEIDILR